MNYPPLWSIGITFAIMLSVFFSLVVLIPSFGKLKRKNGSNGLLFFASVAQMERAEYIERMKEMLKSDAEIYVAILHDLYFESKVLRYKKYRCLKLSYLSLIVGIIIAVLLFFLEHIGLLTTESLVAPFL